MKTSDTLLSVFLIGALFVGTLDGQRRLRPPRTKQLPLIVVAVTPYGFQPEQISVSNGEFYIALRNLTGTEIAVVPKDGSDDSFKSTVPAKQLNRTIWRGLVHFQRFPKPGLYRFTEASHPDWILSLSVEENSR